MNKNNLLKSTVKKFVTSTLFVSVLLSFKFINSNTALVLNPKTAEGTPTRSGNAIIKALIPDIDPYFKDAHIEIWSRGIPYEDRGIAPMSF